MGQAILKRGKLIDRFVGPAGADNIKRVLGSNPCLAGHRRLVDMVCDVSSVRAFSKGEKLIEQGDSSDSVFFVLSGDVQVKADDVVLATRSAPIQVGEMTALKPSKSRVATVIAVNDVVAAEVPGDDFRQLAEDFPDFRTKIAEEMDERQRDNINALKTAGKGGGWLSGFGLFYPFLLGCAIVAGGLAFWFAHDSEVMRPYRFWITFGSALAVFFVGLWFHPSFFYRRTGVMLIAILASTKIFEGIIHIDSESNWGSHMVKYLGYSDPLFTSVCVALAGFLFYLDYRVNYR